MEDIIKSEHIEEKIVSILKKYKYKITTAESCTGGLAASRIIDVPGSSEVFMEGHITYSNAAKERYLKVSPETLKSYGAVSRKTAEEMAAGAAELALAEASLSITGLAGPSGGTEITPVGTVYIGCFVNGKITVEHHEFKGSRTEIREQAVNKALELLYDCLMNK